MHLSKHVVQATSCNGALKSPNGMSIFWKSPKYTNYRPGRTGPVGPVMAGPTFELGRIFSKFKTKLLTS